MTATEQTVIAVGSITAAFIYVVRKLRERSWGWVTNKSSLKGKVFIITGANTGLGYETTRHLVKRGATVILGCRNRDRAKAAISKIRSETKMGEMIFIELDLASFESIRYFVKQIKSDYPTFDCIINNAGLAVRDKKEFTKDNFEIHFGVNHLGHFLLYTLLEENIKNNFSRVVVVSSKMHQRGKIDFDHLGKYNDAINAGPTNPYYNNSKLANFYFAYELYKRGIDCHILCPGLCHTDFFRHYNPRWYHYIMVSPIIWLLLRSAEQGAQNLIYCATDNKNTDTVNPAKGYYIRSLCPEKSKIKFDEVISEKLWDECLKLCSEH